jgi:hypothetical protein
MKGFNKPIELTTEEAKKLKLIGEEESSDANRSLRIVTSRIRMLGQVLVTLEGQSRGDVKWVLDQARTMVLASNYLDDKRSYREKYKKKKGKGGG